MAVKPKIYVFCYGTLKTGNHNHYLVADGTYMGKFITGNQFSLDIAGLPYMTPNEGDGVVGEVFKIDQYTLKQLDTLEGHPEWYTRERISVKSLDTGNHIEVYAYVYRHPIKKAEYTNIVEY